MLIDWFTVAAQIVNFLILVWLMKTFLYKPILTAIDGREKLIAEELKNAASAQEQAKKTQAEFEGKTKTFDLQRDALLLQATEKASAEGQRLTALAKETAQQAGKEEQAKLATTLAKQQADLREIIGRQSQVQVFAITRKLLTEFASSSLENEAVAVFSRRLQTLAEAPREKLARAIETASPAGVVVESAFDLPAKQQADLQKTINSAFKTDATISFATQPQLVSGIKLTVNGQSLEWSISGYLDALEESLTETLNKNKDAVQT